MRTSEILNKAADLIEERGWGQGSETWNNHNGAGLCLEGGILAATGMKLTDDFEACPAYRAVWAHLENDDRWGAYRGSLYNWNDAPGRTAEEVIEVLRATALIEAAKEDQSVAEKVSAQ